MLFIHLVILVLLLLDFWFPKRSERPGYVHGDCVRPLGSHGPSHASLSLPPLPHSTPECTWPGSSNPWPLILLPMQTWVVGGVFLEGAEIQS